MQPDAGWSAGQRALLRFLEQQGILTEEPVAPGPGRPTNADLFAAFADAIDQQDLVDLVTRALKIASVDLAGFAPIPDLIALVPVEVARRGEVIPIAQYDGTLEVAAANPLDLETVKSLEFTTGLRVRTKVALRADVCRALSDAYGLATSPTTAPPAPAAATREDDPAPPAESDEEAIAWEPAPTIDDEPALSIDDGAPDLGRFDDVRLDDTEPVTAWAGGLLAAEPPRVTAPVEPAAPHLSLTVGRPAVLVISRDLARRVAVREALEAAPDAPCVLTMRDDVEARAVLALGGVAAVVVEGRLPGGGGRPLWEELRGGASAIVVWGGRPGASDVVALDLDTDAADVAARVRALLEERGDG